MDNNIIGLINLQGPNYMKELSEARPMASEPFAGKFRLIDFALSTMVNAGVDTVGLLLPFHSRSVLDHVRSGKEWNLARKQHGLFYLPIDEIKEVDDPQPGDIRTYYKNLRFVERELNHYLLLSVCDVVHNIDYDQVLHYHRGHNADITLVYKTLEEDSPGDGYVLTVGETGQVTKMTKVNSARKGDKLYLGSVLMDGDLFVAIVRRAFSQNPNQYLTDVLARNVARPRVYAYEYKGYAKRIHSLQSYYEANMDMLNLENWRAVYRADRKIYTKVKDEAPAKYMADAKVSNSLVGDGCVIEGTVENSILFRRVRVGRNAVVKNSIIMQNTVIGEEARVDRVICDKNQEIQPEAFLTGRKDKPMCITKYDVL
jgi:glucose-1-phosphate adenylyltransferase